MAVTYNNFDNYVSTRATKHALPKYIREVENAHLRSRPFQAMMERLGQVTYNNGGNGLSWQVRVKQRQMQTYTGTGQITFPPTDDTITAALDYAGYIVTESMTYRDAILNGNADESRLIRTFEEMFERLGESIQNQTAPQYFIDGYATGNDGKWKGLKSLFQISSNSINSSTGAARAANSADYVMEPSGTYAGMDISLGANGGTNESGKVWPFGEASFEYDAVTPLVVIGNSSAFNEDGPHTWRAQGEEVLSWAINRVGRNKTFGYQPNYIFMGSTWYEDLKAAQREYRQIIVGPNDDMKELGFGDMVFTMSDGVQIVNEYTLAEDEAIGLNFNACELMVCQDQMFKESGPHEDVDQQRWKWLVTNMSQLKFKSPRNFFHVVNVSGLA